MRFLNHLNDLWGSLGEFVMEDKSTKIPITYTKGDVAIIDEGTNITASSPSQARREYDHSRIIVFVITPST